MSRRGSLRFAAVAGVTLGLLAPAQLARAAPECHGRPATHVGTPGNDQITGTPGPDVMVGLGGADILDGLGGDDALCGGEGASDLLIGGHGDDLLDGGPPGGDGIAYASAPGPVFVDLAAGTATGAHGTDTLFEVENVFGSDFDDSLLGSAEDNAFFPLGGDDVVDARAGDVDAIGYGLSPGSVAVTLAGGTAIGGEGSDTLAGIELVSGSEFDDYLSGDQHDNGLFGQEGHDTIYGRRGNDTLEGGAGNDYLSGGAGEDFASYFLASGPITVALQNGTATGAEGSDTVVAVEAVVGSHYDDRLFGDEADNIFIGNGGDDLLDGDAGLDWVSYFSTTAAEGVTIENPGPVVVDLAAETGFDQSGGDQDTLVDLEAVLGSLGDDVIRGHAGENLLLGDEGDDLLVARAGPDYLSGGPGDDRLLGGKGKRDTASYSAGPTVAADLAQGSATSAEGADQLGSIEVVLGSDEGDTLRGDGARNWLFGGGGGDALFGRGGSDILDGEKGKDQVDGGSGTDFCLDKPNVRCEESDLPPAVRKALKQIKKLEDIAAKKRRGIKSFKSP